MELNDSVFDYCHEGEEKFFNDVYWNERIQRNQGRKEGLEEGRKEGYKEGYKEGLEEGRKEASIEVAKRLIGKWSINEIATVTGLSINEIEKLKEEN